MNLIISNANGNTTAVSTDLSIDRIVSLIQQGFTIPFQESPGSTIYIGADYLKNSIIRTRDESKDRRPGSITATFFQ